MDNSSRNLDRVLCVDDEPRVLEGLELTLHRRFDVTTCTNGFAGLEAVEAAGPFDAIVSDMQMPGMNGVEFFSKIRVIAPGAARILLTGQATMESAISAVNDGHIFKFLTKPCPPETLIRSIDEAVGHYTQARAERTHLEGRIQNLSRQLVQADRLATLGLLADAVGHELSNITTVCIGTVGLMELQARSGLPANARHLETLMGVCDHLTAHSKHLKSLARPHASLKNVLNLCDVVNDTLAALRVTGKTKYIDLQEVLPDAPACIVGNRTEIEQVLINLIGNAVDALSGLPDRIGVVRIIVEIDNDSGTVLCHVEDNGCGIPEDRLAEVFQTYYTTKPPDKGTGLGLAVAKQIVEIHHGTLAVRSRLGVGTTFSMAFPGVKGTRHEL